MLALVSLIAFVSDLELLSFAHANIIRRVLFIQGIYFMCITNGLNIWKISIVAFLRALLYSFLHIARCRIGCDLVWKIVTYMGLAIARVSS
jgi:hypothetical protein